ncbi:lipoprotein NlpI [compost metagenome]
MKICLLAFLIFSFGSVFAQDETHYNRVFDSVSRNAQQQEGIRYFESELKKYPKNELILRSIGALNLQLGNYSETRTYYNKALALNPSCAKCYFFLAQAFANEDKWDEAYQSIEKGIALDPNNGDLYLLRGKLKMHQGNEIGGLNDLGKAISVDPNAIFYMERAQYYIRKGNYFSAKNDLLKGQKTDPKNLQVYNLLAQVYTYENDFTNAIASVNKAIELDATDINSILTRGEVYAMKQDYDLAIEDYKRVIALDPENYHGYYYLAETYYKQEKMDDFCIEITRSLRLIEKQGTDSEFHNYVITRQKDICDSTQSSFYYQRGIAQFNLDKSKEAIEFYNRGIAKFPNEYMIYSFRGNAQLHLLNNREAIADYQNSLEHIDQVTSEIAKSASYSSVQSKDSLELATKAFKSSTYLSLAFCYFNLEQTDSALYCINQSILHKPDLKEYSAVDALFMKGILLLDKNQYEEARKTFTEASELAPDWSVCKDYLALSLIAQVKPAPLTRNKLQIRNLLDLEDLHWTLPYKITKGSGYFDQALEHIAAALRLNPSDYFAVYLRAYVNRQLGIKACEDFKLANQLGYPVELNYLKDCR